MQFGIFYYGGKMITTNQAMEAIAMAELLEFLYYWKKRKYILR